MSIQAGEAYIPVRADMSEFGSEVKQGTEKASGSIRGFAKSTAAVLGGAFVAGQVKDFFGTAIDGARGAIAIDKQTEAVIKSTGGAAGVTAEAIDSLANKLQQQQGLNDEMIQTGANLLLTFTNLRNGVGEGNDIFDQTVELAGDMSTALGQDVKSSAIQLGKALNDPLKGMTALSRVGVSFTADQQEMVKEMVASGDTMGAQKLILEELNKEFGGSAAAQADASTRMALAWDDFQEVVGRLVIPMVDKLLVVLTDIAEWATENPGKLKILAGVVGGALALGFTAWAISAAAAAAATIAAAAPVIAVGIAIGALVAGLIYAYENWDWFRDVVDGVASFLTNTVWPVLQVGAQFFTETLLPAIRKVGDFVTGTFVPAVAGLVRFFDDKLRPVVERVVGWFGDMKRAAGFVVDALKAPFDAVRGFGETLGLIDRQIELSPFWSQVFGLSTGDIGVGIGNVGSGVIGAIGNVANTATGGPTAQGRDIFGNPGGGGTATRGGTDVTINIERGDQLDEQGVARAVAWSLSGRG